MSSLHFSSFSDKKTVIYDGHTKLLWFAWITIYSVLVFACLLYGNKDAFYVDDNYMQWGPVIRRGFDQIFLGGGIPYWDFYQYKGLDIFSSGYYGFVNPFMYISYVLSRYVFGFGLETLVIYEWLMYWMGLLFMCSLLNDLFLRPGTVFVSVFAYSASVIFFSHSFYYFSFNSFYFVPFFAWTVFRIRNIKYARIIPGILLAFSLLLGHVQYTCFYITLYCIMEVMFAILQRDSKRLVNTVSNLAVFGILSGILLVLSLNVSADRNMILSGQPSAFLDGAVSILSVFSSVYFVPFAGKLNRHEMEQIIGLGIFAYFALAVVLPPVKDTRKQIALLLGGVVLILFFPFMFFVLSLSYCIYYVYKTSEVYSDKQTFTLAIAFSALFFMIIGAGREGVIAVILSHLPVIGQFRFLYKCAFIYIPLVIICGAVFLDSINNHLKIFRYAAFLSGAVSLCTTIYIIRSGVHPYINASYYDYNDYRRIEEKVDSQLDEIGADRNYRFLAFIDTDTLKRGRDDVTPEEIKQEAIEISSSISPYAFNKNLATYYKVFSAGGYDNVFTAKSFEQTDQIMNDIYYEGMMTDTSFRMKDLLAESKNGDLSEFQEQMVDNGIRYVLLDNLCLYDFRSIIDACDKLFIEREIAWYNTYDLVEVGGTRAVCSDEKGNEIPLDISLDALGFETDFEEDTGIIISMTYDEHYRLEMTDEGGRTIVIAVSETPGGYVAANVPGGKHAMRLVYKNRLMDLAVAVSCLTLILTAVSFVIVIRNKPFRIIG